VVYFTDGSEAERLDRRGVRALAELMGLAFTDHDNWKRVIPDADRRRRALTRMFRFMGSVVNRYGHVVVTVEDGRKVGYTTFMENRDREQVSFRRVVRCGALGHALGFLASLRPAELAAMRSFTATIEGAYGDLNLDTRGLHLYTTAVEPALKGRGLMKRSFAYAEDRFRTAGFSSYFLETTDPANLPVYERFGLKLIRSATMPASGRSVWFFHKTLA